MREKGRKKTYVCGLGHVELVEQLFALTNCPLMCEVRSSYIYKQFMPTTTDNDGATPYLPATTGRRL